MRKKRPSIKEFGRIMQDAFQACVEKMELDNDFCIYLDGAEYTQKDFDRFLVESVPMYDDCCIDGYAETVEGLENFTFMGEFPLCFKEGQKYRDTINEISKRIEGEGVC